MRLLASLFLFACCSGAFAQGAKSYEEKSDKKFEEGDYQYAMMLIDKAIALEDTNHWLLLKKAEIEFKISGPLAAVEVVKKAVYINPQEAESYSRAGRYYQSAGVIDSALLMYDKAIGYADNDTSKYAYVMNRGTAKLARRDFEGALNDFKEVLEYDPHSIGALNNIAPVYRELGMVDEAIKSLQTIISIDSTFVGPYVNLGFIYTHINKHNLAIKYFNKALEIDPEEPLVFSNRGYAYYKLGDYQKALKDINKSISLYPTNSYAYRNLALVYIDTKMMNKACEALSYALAYGFTLRYGDEVKDLLRKHCDYDE